MIIRQMRCPEASARLGQGQYHLAVAGGCAAFWEIACGAHTRYSEVVLTLSNHGA